jgi:hypothetical protein
MCALGVGNAADLPLVVNYGKLPLAFESAENQDALFLARAHGFVASLEQSGAVRITAHRPAGSLPETIRMSFPGARKRAEALATEPFPGKANYLLGSDSRQWRVAQDMFAKVSYKGLYPGVDLVYYGNQQELEYDFILAPGVPHQQIQLTFEGAAEVTVEPDGDLTVTASGSSITQHPPLAYQLRGSERQPLQARYALVGPNTVSFEIEDRNMLLPLVIDPTVIYSTYIGGTGDDRAYAVAVDSSGCAYLAGETGSASLSGSIGGYRSYPDAFLMKLNSTGSGIAYITYVGGSSRDSARGLVVDAAGYVYLTGFTYSANFPLTGSSFGRSAQGADSFVAKLDPNGHLVYATLLGGASDDLATGIAVAPNGEPVITGYTNSINFPSTSGAIQHAYGGGTFNAFLAHLDATGQTIRYATYLGGVGNDTANAITSSASGSIYIAGQTNSPQFPCSNPPQGTNSQSVAFATELDTSGQVVFSTCLGGRGPSTANAIAVDAAGAAYLAGSTWSNNFPVTSGAFQSLSGGGYDAFIAKLSPAGTIDYATYLGGSGSESAYAIAVDPAGRAFVAGDTASANFPYASSPQPVPQGAMDAFVVGLDPQGRSMFLSALIGGGGDDVAQAIALDGAGAVYLAGYTLSGNFPTTAGTVQAHLMTGADAFVAKFVSNGLPLMISPASGTGLSQTFSATFSAPNGQTGLSGSWILINSVFTAGGCFLGYEASTNSLLLWQDGTSSWSRVVLGSAGALENSYCVATVANSSAIFAGGILTLNVAVSFKPAFAGSKSLFLFAQGKDGAYSEVLQSGSWTVAATPPPSPLSVAPSSGIGMIQTFTARLSIPGVLGTLSGAWLVINTGFMSHGACFISYQPASNTVGLWMENTQSWSTATVGAQDIVDGTYCSLNAATASAIFANGVLTLALPLTFKQAFAGTKSIYLFSQSGAGAYSEIFTAGSWNVIEGSSAGPVSVTPSSGSTASQAFTGTLSISGDSTKIPGAWFLVQHGFSAGNSCFVMYAPASNTLSLYLDATQTWSAGVAVGAAANLQNSQCVLNVSASQVLKTQTAIVMNVSLTFNHAFAGPKELYLFAQNSDGTYSNILNAGSWVVP